MYTYNVFQIASQEMWHKRLIPGGASRILSLFIVINCVIRLCLFGLSLVKET